MRKEKRRETVSLKFISAAWNFISLISIIDDRQFSFFSLFGKAKLTKWKPRNREQFPCSIKSKKENQMRTFINISVKTVSIELTKPSELSFSTNGSDKSLSFFFFVWSGDCITSKLILCDDKFQCWLFSVRMCFLLIHLNKFVLETIPYVWIIRVERECTRLRWTWAEQPSGAVCCTKGKLWSVSRYIVSYGIFNYFCLFQFSLHTIGRKRKTFLW